MTEEENQKWFAKKLGQNIRRVRLSKNMTRQQIADKSGVSVERLKLLEEGRLGLNFSIEDIKLFLKEVDQKKSQ